MKCNFFGADVVCAPLDQPAPAPNETTTIRTEELEGLRDRLRAAEHYLSIRRHLREELEAELGTDTRADSEAQTRHAVAQIKRWKKIEAAAWALHANIENWLATGEVAGPVESQGLFEPLDRALRMEVTP
jgi:hypothetical protein